MMHFKILAKSIAFHFQKEDVTADIQSILSMAKANIVHEKETLIANIPHTAIADLNVHQIKKLGLPPVYPYRLKIETRGRPSTPAFSYTVHYLDEKSRRFYHVKRNGVILELDDKKFTLTNPHFQFLEALEKMSPDKKNPGERLELWTEVIKNVPEEIALTDPHIWNFQFVKADRFCVSTKSTGDFQIVPELIYKPLESELDEKPCHQLPGKISQEFQDQFLKAHHVDPYYKVGNYYVHISKPLKECFKVIQKINNEPIEKRKAFYLNPMERIKKEIPENVSEDLLEDIFFETDQFQSDRISHLGKWVPKIGIYIDPDDVNPLVSKR